MPRPPSVPKLTRHKASSRGVVRLSGRDHYLGPWPAHLKEPPAEVRAAYDRLVAEWLARGRRPAGEAPNDAAARKAGPSVAEVVLAFWHHVQRHYRHPDGTPTGEVDGFRLSLRPLRELYGLTPAAEFSPLKLKAVRQKMIDAGLSRKVINQRAGRIRRCFRWAASEEMVPVAVFQGLAAVAGLQQGRSAAPEREPVGPVADEVVEKTLPFLSRHVRAMVQLQRLTGMRPGEVVRLRRGHLDTSGPVWWYSPKHHKTAWRGRTRLIGIGPKARAVLGEFLTDDADAWVFSPRLMMAEYRAAQRAKSGRGKKPGRRKPRKVPGDRYTVNSYRVAVMRAARRAGVPHWSPNQLRHARGTEVRRRYGLEAAQVALGHERADVTQVYAERDQQLAAKVAAEIG